MNKTLRSKRLDITDYNVRLWGDTCFIENRYNLDIILQRDNNNNLLCFGLQTNLSNEDKEEKVIRMCEEIENKIRELDQYLKEGE